MYAVIKTGGKQYRVQPGDVLVVEKLDGEVGAAVKFDQVLMHGEGAEVTLGAPLVDGALVHATLIETRKGEKIKIFKKIRRQGYRRTRGHRQTETVLRVTGLEVGGKTTKWDGEVSLASKALLDAKARGLTNVIAALEGAAPKTAKTLAKAKIAAKKAVAEGVVDEQEAAVEAPAKAAPKAKAEAKPATEAPKTEAKAKPAPKAKAEAATAEETAAPKKKAAPKAKPASDDAK